ncbi:glycerophosphodiester phosphodiesterase family protein [Mumia sp. ZJ430]|uniref:glycerophosphodiester phosphodiesterase n=1 Tax=Mumia sp. ZJ430 TaxID=2708083 RepID=UPI001422D405|nr:glycerophosphodiester phosphodiesterase family protein [Mumia sp. ZJ430]
MGRSTIATIAALLVAAGLLVPGPTAAAATAERLRAYDAISTRDAPTRVARAPRAAPARPMLGEATTLRGTIPSRQRRPVVLQQRRNGTWRTVARAMTRRDGTYRFRVAAARTRLRVVAPRRAARGLPRVRSRSARLVPRPQQLVATVPHVVARRRSVTLRVRPLPARAGRRVTIVLRHPRLGTRRVTLRTRAAGTARTRTAFARSGAVQVRVTARRYRGAAATTVRRRLRVVPRPRPAVVSHRGLFGAGAENTVPAFTRAVAVGADAVEADVRRTSDGVLFLIHDETFARTTDVAAVFPGREDDPVGSFTWAEVRRLDAAAGRSTSPTPVPSLDELLRAVDKSGVRVVLDVKRPDLYPRIEVEVLETAQARGLVRPGDGDLVRFDCFDWTAAHRIALADPDAETGLLAMRAPPSRLTPYRWADQWVVNQRVVDASLLARVRASGAGLDVWTVNSPSAALDFADLGVDALITDNLPALRRVLR